MSVTPLTYSQLSSSINPSFWSKLTDIKLNEDKLNENSHDIWGYFNNLNTSNCPVPLLDVDSTSFNSYFNDQNLYVPFHGKLLNKNTIEQFKEINKTSLINQIGWELMGKMRNGDVLKQPSLLNTFFVLSFADLKKYHYYYWFAFPVPSSLTVEKVGDGVEISEKYSNEILSDLYNEYRSLEPHEKPYFIIEKQGNNLKIHKLSSKLSQITSNNHNDYLFGFYDNSYNSIPGSQLRNYVAFILHYCPFLCGQQKVFVAFHLNRFNSSISCSKSILYTLQLPNDIITGNESNYNWVGWEKNERDKMGPRLANMKSSLDPLILAENAIDLNLKLMKWRLLPEIDLDKIKSTKCLLLGSGTLGCSVARTLLAWGVRTINFVDNSTVSFSNPVRQNLFTYSDSVEMKSKCEAAAQNLKLIFPGVDSKGFQINIPMPGHSVGENLWGQTKLNVDLLEKLIVQHDVIFLLMDSRESRWLPTLLGKFHKKIVINAALGFDTYLVMRHGGDSNNFNSEKSNVIEGFKTISGSNLGCYFCNDVTAPGNSMKDRTLDQQCTVTRPGVSQIAAALAVELAVSIIQHKEGNNAEAFYKVGQNGHVSELENQCVLGLLPHSIRGFLTGFNQVLPATQQYKQCIACSDVVLKEYKEKRDEFLLNVFNSSKYLEEVTGLSDMFNDVNFDDIWELSDDEKEDN